MVLVLSPPTPPDVSVLMPVFDQGTFVPRALGGLFAQTMQNWELVVIDDGSSDGTVSVVAPYLRDPRVRYRRLHHNLGLGAALNHGLATAGAPFVAYLPADDVWFPTHLASLLSCMDAGVALAHAGLRHHPAGDPLQLVQVLHRATEDRWVEREELESDDLDRLFWSRLRARGRFVGTGAVTCEWVDHPGQRHKAILESHDGGLNVFRSRYRVRTPLQFHSSETGTVDEVARYRRFRDRPPTPRAPDGLRILLVGELAYNPERVLAFEERGHRLYGLWTPDGLGFNTVGPLPFGHVEDLPARDWEGALERVRPDLIYALLNWRAVPFAHAVLSASPGVPFVWHFKEAPQRCLLRGRGRSSWTCAPAPTRRSTPPPRSRRGSRPRSPAASTQEGASCSTAISPKVTGSPTSAALVCPRATVSSTPSSSDVRWVWHLTSSRDWPASGSTPTSMEPVAGGGGSGPTTPAVARPDACMCTRPSAPRTG